MLSSENSKFQIFVFILKKAKLSDIVATLEHQILQEKDDIINKSDSPADCISHMSDRIDELGNDYVKEDDFLTTLPTGEIDTLKKNLKPKFEKLYVTLFNYRFLCPLMLCMILSMKNT